MPYISGREIAGSPPRAADVYTVPRQTLMYYFTGTGNSLAAARRIAGIIGDTRLVPVAAQVKTQGTIKPDADRVGIVCPVYDAGIPVMVDGFLRRLDIRDVPYLFAVVTMGGLGRSALHQIDDTMRDTWGKGLCAGFAVKMPGNFPPVSVPPAKEKAARILSKADKNLTGIADQISDAKIVPPGFEPVSALMKCVTYGPFSKTVHTADTKFSADDSCTGCGTCVQVCPAVNIVLENSRPVWKHQCESCCACLHFCPVEAIQFNVMRGTKGRGRYRHPDLTVSDMKAQKGEWE